MTDNGWSEKQLEEAGLIEVIDKFYDFAYAVKNNTRKSSNFGDTWQDMAEFLEEIASELNDCAEKIEAFTTYDDDIDESEQIDEKKKKKKKKYRKTVRRYGAFYPFWPIRPFRPIPPPPPPPGPGPMPPPPGPGPAPAPGAAGGPIGEAELANDQSSFLPIPEEKIHEKINKMDDSVIVDNFISCFKHIIAEPKDLLDADFAKNFSFVSMFYVGENDKTPAQYLLMFKDNRNQNKYSVFMDFDGKKFFVPGKDAFKFMVSDLKKIKDMVVPESSEDDDTEETDDSEEN